MDLDPEQRRAVEYSGPALLVRAGPGSGKTRVIVERVLHMVRNGADPGRILCLTFSEKAAGEMLGRLKESIDTTEMDVCTFHSFAKQILEDNEPESGIVTSRGTISGPAGAAWAAAHIDEFKLGSHRVVIRPHEVIRKIMEGISGFKRELVTPGELEKYLEGEENGELKDLCSVYQRYQGHLREMGIIDFDDMVSEAVRLFRARDDVRSEYGGRYSHILVDELQDANYAQLELVRLIAGNITAVGDENQSIYGFQGAYTSGFENFDDITGGAETISLNNNYRCTKTIAGLAAQCIANTPSGSQAGAVHPEGSPVEIVECADEDSEAACIADRIVQIRSPGGESAGYSIAVLTRKIADGKKFSDELELRGVPARYSGGDGIFSAGPARELLTYLEIARAPASAGGEINLLMKKHGIPEGDIAVINTEAKKAAYNDIHGNDHVLEVIRRGGNSGVRKKAELAGLVRRLDKVITLAGSYSPGTLAYHIAVPLAGLFRNLEDGAGAEHLREACRLATEYDLLDPRGGLDGLVGYLWAANSDKNLRSDADAGGAVEVTTIHKSKGREFDAVFIADAVEDRLPLKYKGRKYQVPTTLLHGRRPQGKEKDRHMQEERRLLYVAMTRAKKNLCITYSKEYASKKTESKPSRFLEEMQFRSNPLVRTFVFAGGPAQGAGTASTVSGLQEEAMRAVSVGDHGTAVQKVTDLAALEYMKEHGGLDGFVPPAARSPSPGLGAGAGPAKPAPLRLSSTKIGTYKKCPLMYWFAHVMTIPSPPGIPMVMGGVIHKVLEKITDAQMNGQTPDEAGALAMLEGQLKYAVYDSRTSFEQSKEEAESMISWFVKWSAGSPNKPIAVEKKFELEIAGAEFRGSIDRVERTPDGGLVLIDYKTGRTKVSPGKIAEDVQLNLYAEAAKKLYKELPEKAVLLYLESGETVEYRLDEASVKSAIGRIEEYVDGIREGRFDPTPAVSTCMFCDYSGMCDYAV
ncbi:superfamily I helicase [Cenarchaeum symbiosum A]|uniref:DNA 3'-5' helicase n=1 Tax=Cenarchaeum symbiosum (strain A) TaxID=414004 RepID=A0RUT2_CENSY|nr:superfamily I helicase [Cenarchaeum symbiosum A]